MSFAYSPIIITQSVSNGGGSSSPSGAAGGDLGSTYPNPTVVGLRGTSISSNSPIIGGALVYNGSLYLPSGIIPGNGAASNARAIGVTVGPVGCDYVYLSQAVNVGKQTLCYLLGSVDEIDNIHIPSSGLTLYINNASLNMNNFRFETPNSAQLKIEGLGNIDYSEPSGDVLFAGALGRVTVNDIDLTSNSSNYTALCEGRYSLFSQVTLDGSIGIRADNVMFSDCFWRSTNILIESGIQNVQIIGGKFEQAVVIDSGVNTVISSITSTT